MLFPKQVDTVQLSSPDWIYPVPDLYEYMFENLPM
jgi:hypothetical protein